MGLYVFEEGEYSDWRVSGVVEGPDDAPLDELLGEWAIAVRAASWDPEDDYGWRFDDDAMRKAAGNVDGPDWACRAEWFAIWLVQRKGWKHVDTKRFRVDPKEDE